jgi:hypothetical protein
VKLRLEPHSLRLRLSPQDLQQLAATGLLRQTIAFAPGRVLVYQLELAQTAELAAELTPALIRVLLPETPARQWIQSTQVGIEFQQSAGPDVSLSIIVEKDLDPREKKKGR